jgi:hypothetical protein
VRRRRSRHAKAPAQGVAAAVEGVLGGLPDGLRHDPQSTAGPFGRGISPRWLADRRVIGRGIPFRRLLWRWILPRRAFGRRIFLGWPGRVLLGWFGWPHRRRRLGLPNRRGVPSRRERPRDGVSRECHVRLARRAQTTPTVRESPADLVSRCGRGGRRCPIRLFGLGSQGHRAAVIDRASLTRANDIVDSALSATAGADRVPTHDRRPSAREHNRLDLVLRAIGLERRDPLGAADRLALVVGVVRAAKQAEGAKTDE